jgi:hypothetical protein
MRLALKFKESGDRLNLNFGEVYQISDGGFEKGYNEGYDKGNKDGQQIGYQKGYDLGYQDGEKSVVDFSKICSQIRFPSLNVFGKKEVVLNLDNVLNLEDFCREETASDVNTTVEHITINCPNESKSAAYMFRTLSPYDYTLKRVTLNVKFANTANWNYVFSNKRALEVIDGEPLNMASNYTANTFQYCYALKEVRIVPNCATINFDMQFCSSLSKESIESVINGLSSEVIGFTAKLKLQAVNKAFETSVGTNDGSNSTEWKALADTKKNWTITLS